MATGFGMTMTNILITYTLNATKTNIQSKKKPPLGRNGGERIGENRLNDSDKSRVKHYVRCLQE